MENQKIVYPTEAVTSLEGKDPRLHSVVVGENNYDVPAPHAVGSKEFDREIELFLEARNQVAAGMWPTQYFIELGIDPEIPEMFQKIVGLTHDDPLGAVRLVDHTMDSPKDLHNVFTEHFGTKLKTAQSERHVQSTGVDFLGARWLDKQVDADIYHSLVEAFKVKYFYAFPRPEHHFNAGVLVAEYPCPPHCSYIAGHGAFAGATVETWISYVDLSEVQVEEAIHAGRHLAHYRTLAGVHWAMDNTEGFNLGRTVVSKSCEAIP